MEIAYFIILCLYKEKYFELYPGRAKSYLVSLMKTSFSSWINYFGNWLLNIPPTQTRLCNWTLQLVGFGGRTSGGLRVPSRLCWWKIGWGGKRPLFWSSASCVFLGELCLIYILRCFDHQPLTSKRVICSSLKQICNLFYCLSSWTLSNASSQSCLLLRRLFWKSSVRESIWGAVWILKTTSFYHFNGFYLFWG